MSTTFKEARSGINPANLQEVLDAESSAAWATLQGQNQYFTPSWLVTELARHLPTNEANRSYPPTMIDPQVGEGALLDLPLIRYPHKYGIDIDARIKPMFLNHHLRFNSVEVFEALDDVAPDLVWTVFNANPPFGKRWKLSDGSIVDSTKWTWERAIRHGMCGIFISNKQTIERLGIDKHPFVKHYQTNGNVWKGCEVVVGAVVWHNPNAPTSDSYRLSTAWQSAAKILEEESKNLPKWNIWIDGNGKLNTYLSTRTQVKRKLTREDILRLDKIKGSHPLALTVERETRKLLQELVDCGFYTIQPEAQKAIVDALGQAKSHSAPIMPPTEFELVAYADEEDHLVCINGNSGFPFTAGKQYELSTATYSFTQEFKRKKVHYDEQNKQTYTSEHTCSLSGQDRYIQVYDDNRVAHRFMDRPDPKFNWQHDESVLWKIFQKPVIKTIAETNPDLVEKNIKSLRMCEMLAGYTYYPGQIGYLSRVASKDYGLIAADVGTGKSLMAITLLALKGPHRALIVAPQGTMRGGDEEDEDEDGEPVQQASQWISELRRFAPYLQIFEMFSYDDYTRITRANGGVLPPGVYVSYFQAMFSNGARESCPSTWTDEKYTDVYGVTVPPVPADITDEKEREKYWCNTIGKEVNGIRCIASPCLSTRIGHMFDMVLVDECHYMCNLNANITQMLIRMQPRYRYGLTATPIPNVVLNMFSLMGWLCVEDWYKGDRRNPAWPYAREEIGRFEGTFHSKERDLTEEHEKLKANPRWRGKCEKTSPVISSPARLLKIIRPTLSYISKLDCNPKLVPVKIVDVRVPMGKQQAKLYGHFLNRANIKCSHPLVRARKQIAYLRNICADPQGFTHGGPNVSSNYNPKTIAVLELIKQILGRGEQVVIVSSRVGQTDTLAMKLMDAGVKFARIDSTIPADQHASQSNLFKSGKARVMLMGIKCAVGHSYPECPNLIIGSLEYSYGSKHQAEGRVYRVNSKLPVTIYCVLHMTSIEELMFDVVATKADAATICLHGKRIPRDFKPVDASEVLANAISTFSSKDQQDEMVLEGQWPKLRDAIRRV